MFFNTKVFQTCRQCKEDPKSGQMEEPEEVINEAEAVTNPSFGEGIPVNNDYCYVQQE